MKHEQTMEPQREPLSPKPRLPLSPTLRVFVDDDTIDRAIPRDSNHCMVAEAVRLAYPTARHIAVDLQTIRFTDPQKNLRYTYLTPRTAQKALVQFDLGEKPVAFAFTLHKGQTTRAGGHKRSSVQQTDQQIAAREKANEARSPIVLVKGHGKGDTPTPNGGKPPPLQTRHAIPFTRRRSFGLRGLER